MRLTLGTAFIALALGGCTNQFGGSLFYLKPYNIENQTCAQLKAAVDGTAGAIAQKSELREKAGADTVGSAVGTAVYGPDENASIWLHRQYEAEYKRKNCDAPAPPASPPPAASPAPAASPQPEASTPAGAMPPITPPPR